MNFTPFPAIETDRLLLRKTEESDVEEMLFLRSDEVVNQYIERPEEDKTKTKDDALKFIRMITGDIKNNKSITWAITLKGHPKMIGSICLWNFSEDKKVAEVGYSLHPDFFRKGIMTESLIKILNYGFGELNLHKIEAYTLRNNESSKRLLEKNGFQIVANKVDKHNAANLVYEISNTGETNLKKLILNMEPVLNEGDYVFATVLDIESISRAITICEVKEKEGVTVVLLKKDADNLGLKYEYIASWITLNIHSSLEAVGLTAAFSSELGANGISCNVIAGYYHDHIFVDKKDSQKAVEVLLAMTNFYSK